MATYRTSVYLTTDEVEHPVDLAECPDCFAIVRRAKLNAHIDKVHS